MIKKPEIEMPKKYLWIWIVLFILFSGFVGYFLIGDLYIGIVHQESKSVLGNNVEFKFSLSPEQSSYDAVLVVDYECTTALETVTAKVISPSEKTYSSQTKIGERKQKDCAIKEITSFKVKDIQYENGTFRVVINKEGDRNKIKDITLKIKK